MELNSNTRSIIERIGAKHDGTIVFEEAEMQQALATEAEKYQGLGIKALSVVGGFLASSFFVGYMVMSMSGLPMVLLVCGLIAMGIAVLIGRESKTAILDTISISTFLSANLMLGMAMYQFTKSDNSISLALLAISLIVPFLTSGYMLNLLSAAILQGCLFALMNVNGGKELIHLFPILPAAGFTWLSLNEPGLITRSWGINIRFNAWRTGLLFALIASLVYSASLLFDLPGSSYHWKQLLALPIWGSLLIVFVSFHTGHKMGLLSGILLLIYVVGQFYYNLHFTLLTKSFMMMGTGLMFLMAWFIFKKKLKEHEQD